MELDKLLVAMSEKIDKLLTVNAGMEEKVRQLEVAQSRLDRATDLESNNVSRLEGKISEVLAAANKLGHLSEKVLALEIKVSAIQHTIDEHKSEHKDHEKQNQSRSWQLWIIVIMVIVNLAVTFITKTL